MPNVRRRSSKIINSSLVGYLCQAQLELMNGRGEMSLDACLPCVVGVQLVGNFVYGRLLNFVTVGY